MCRSEPHIAQAVTLMITSPASSILGSRTSSQGYLPSHAMPMLSRDTPPRRNNNSVSKIRDLHINVLQGPRFKCQSKLFWTTSPIGLLLITSNRSSLLSRGPGWSTPRTDWQSSISSCLLLALVLRGLTIEITRRNIRLDLGRSTASTRHEDSINKRRAKQNRPDNFHDGQQT